MKKLALFGCLLCFSLVVRGQYASHSISKYQFNQLSINPAFSGSGDFGRMEIMYYGNFVGQFALYRGMEISLQAPFWSSDHSHWGAQFGFEKSGAEVALSFNPSYSYAVDLAFGRLSFGGSVGFGFFDFDESLLVNPVTDFRNFVGLNASVGVFLSSEKYFAGVSSLRIYETDFLDDSRDVAQAFNRENPYYLSAGFQTRVSERFELRPSVLVKYADYYLLPETGDPTLPAEFAADLNLSLIMDENYYVSGIYGFSKFEDGQRITRLGFMLHMLFGNIRLSYGVQNYFLPENGTNLPASHLFSLGYRFLDETE